MQLISSHPQQVHFTCQQYVSPTNILLQSTCQDFLVIVFVYHHGWARLGGQVLVVPVGGARPGGTSPQLPVYLFCICWGDGVGRWCWCCVVVLCGAGNVNKWLVVSLLVKTGSVMGQLWWITQEMLDSRGHLLSILKCGGGCVLAQQLPHHCTSWGQPPLSKGKGSNNHYHPCAPPGHTTIGSGLGGLGHRKLRHSWVEVALFTTYSTSQQVNYVVEVFDLNVTEMMFQCMFQLYLHRWQICIELAL